LVGGDDHRLPQLILDGQDASLNERQLGLVGVRLAPLGEGTELALLLDPLPQLDAPLELAVELLLQGGFAFRGPIHPLCDPSFSPLCGIVRAASRVARKQRTESHALSSRGVSGGPSICLPRPLSTAV